MSDESFTITLDVLPLGSNGELWPILPAPLILALFAARRDEARADFADDARGLRAALTALDDAEAQVLEGGACVARLPPAAATTLTFGFRRAVPDDDRTARTAALAGAHAPGVGGMAAGEGLGGRYRDALAARTWRGCHARGRSLVTGYAELPDGLRAVLALLVGEHLDFAPSVPSFYDILGGPLPPRPHQET